jgi:hypothetical protein
LYFLGQEIHPRESLKILGVTLCTKLNMDTHNFEVVGRTLAKWTVF